MRLGSELRFNVQASDPDLGTSLTFGGINLPQGATLNPATGEFVWRPGPGQTGEFLVGVTATDGEATASQMIVIRAGVDVPTPSVIIELTPSFPVTPGSTVLVHVIADSLADITSLTATFNGQPLVLDAQGRGYVTPSAPGKLIVNATATDADGLVGTASATLKVRDPNDTAPPVVILDATTGDPLLRDGVVNGAVRDTNLDFWTLEIQRLGGDTFQTIATGNDAINGGPLAVLDVAAMPNGFYVLRLTARDIGNRLARTEATIEVRTASKRAFTLTETDLLVTLGGTTVAVARAYDSTSRDESGRFGYGWRLLNRELNIRTSTPLTGHEDQGLYQPYRQGTRLYLSAPNGDEVGFRFNPVRHDEPGVTYFTPAWEILPESAPGWTLETTGLKLMKAGSLFFELSTGRPYNPASPFFQGEDFALNGPDGTRYGVDIHLGIISQKAPGGTTIYVGDSGLVTTSGEAIQFVYDNAGRIDRVVAPDGRVVVYTYSDQGDLIAARTLTTGASSRYGYDLTTPHQLTTTLKPDGTGSAIVHSTLAPPTIFPIADNLGTATNFDGQTVSGALADGASARHAFSVRASEINSTATGEVLIRVSVRATSGTLQPQVPQIPGLTPRSTFVGGDRADALFAIPREGLYHIVLSGAPGTSGNYAVEINVAGDLNADGFIDGLDSTIMADAQGSSEGQPGYVFAADLDGSGVIDATDSQVLARNYGFRANLAPTANPDFPAVMTHVDLAVPVALGDAVIDPDGDTVIYQLVSATGGTATLSPDGRTVLFTPTPGFSGAAGFTVKADDGFSSSASAFIPVQISTATLLSLDIANRTPHLALGERRDLVVLGNFADQQDVPLLGDYVTYVTSNGSVLSVDSSGTLRGLAEGYAAVTARRGNLAAATAVTVGTPADPLHLGNNGLFVYPGSLTLPEVGGQRQFLVKGNDTDISTAADGTLYFVADTSVVSLTPDGFATSAGLGETTVTIINGPAEKVVTVKVVQPALGSATIGAEGRQSSRPPRERSSRSPPARSPRETSVALHTLPTGQVEAAFDSAYEVGTTFELDFGGHVLSQPAQMMIPVGASFQPRRHGLLLQAGDDDSSRRLDPGHLAPDRVRQGRRRRFRPDHLAALPGLQRRRTIPPGQDGHSRRSSSASGSEPRRTSGTRSGSLPTGTGIPTGLGLLPIPYTLDIGITFLIYARNPKEIPHAEQTPAAFVLPQPG